MLKEENKALLSFWLLWGIIDKSRRHRAEEVLDEELEALRAIVKDDEEHDLVDDDMAELQRLIDPPEELSLKRKPTWAHEAIQDAKRYGAPEGSLRESKRPHIYSSYMALLSDIIDAEPFNFEDAVGKQVWKDVMHEEYQS